jgi:hypothetical protein
MTDLAAKMPLEDCINCCIRKTPKHGQTARGSRVATRNELNWHGRGGGGVTSGIIVTNPLYLCFSSRQYNEGTPST